MNTLSQVLPPIPPFTHVTALEKVRKAEDVWNSRDPQRVCLAYAIDCRWRNRAEFPTGRQQIVDFLTRKWNRELDYRLIKELWTFSDNRIRSGSLMNITMTPGNGRGHMVTRTGNSIPMASCRFGMRPSMI